MDGEERSKREERGGGASGDYALLRESLPGFLPRDRLALGLTPAKMDRRFHSLRPRTLCSVQQWAPWQRCTRLEDSAVLPPGMGVAAGVGRGLKARPDSASRRRILSNRASRRCSALLRTFPPRRPSQVLPPPVAFPLAAAGGQGCRRRARRVLRRRVPLGVGAMWKGRDGGPGGGGGGGCIASDSSGGVNDDPSLTETVQEI